MGIFTSIKNKLGIGGVKVNLQAPAQVSMGDSTVDGKVILTTKSEQEVLNLTVKFIEEFTTGRGDNKTTKDFDLGEIVIPGNFTIKPGETKEVPFSLPFQIVKSDADNLKEKGGALGAVGSLSKFANNEKSEYFIDAEADVKSAALDPSDKKEVKLV
ncbi:sporulation protein [Flavivirga aquimarina]|uniref:Sporulation protein n=1 Tax=Flavivirga aquimarina TaxID=2027862 RepID=A0ABT8W975_9FLAO|nr:sporulation protein [Flavivirga aquimarina]MDO5969680.1 sporulation protein [Flavivirga aquimarina]